MRNFLKTYIQPILRTFGIQRSMYTLFFFINKIIRDGLNIYDKKFKKTGAILTYHRIATVTHDPHSLCVPINIFEQHLEFLSTHYELISLHDLCTRIQEKNLKGTEIVLTLDDGYRDNLENALPLLEKYHCPVTIFVTTSRLGKTADAAWDMEYITKDRASFLSATEVLTLSKHPLVTIGAHTHSHVRLSEQSPSQQAEEIQTNKQILEQLIGQKVLDFAYPFGGIFDYTSTTRKILQASHFKTISTTRPRLITNTTNIHNLPRFNIRAYSIEILIKTIFSKQPNPPLHS